jgi:hypothetical protein
MMNNNIMIDIETLGTVPGSMILSIGAVCLETESEFYVKLDHTTQMGLTQDLSTLKWWAQQDSAVREEAFSGTTELRKGLMDLAEGISKDSLVWGNGANFDIVLLEEAYRSVRLPIPWSYRNVRCYRTLAAAFPHIKKPTILHAHNALADAKGQAAHLKEILNALP